MSVTWSFESAEPEDCDFQVSLGYTVRMKNIWSVCHSFCRWNSFENEDTGHMLVCKGLVFKSCAFSSSVVQAAV